MGALIIIAGPTCTGKTALSIRLAQAIGGEIISCDSMQIYRDMDIGTAKATTAEMEGVPHHLLSYVDPNCSYSVAEYQKAACAVIDDILSRGKVPIMVGGTGLYIESVLYPMDFKAYDEGTRNEITNELQRIGNQAMWEKLHQADPAMADKISPNDSKRLIRCFELLSVGETHNREDNTKTPRYPHALFVLERERSALYNAINKRVDVMIARGLEDEVKALMAQGCSSQSQSFGAIGYKELALCYEHEGSEYTREWAIETIKKRSRNYAKRQLTWFRHYPQAIWLDADKDNLDTIVDWYKQH